MDDLLVYSPRDFANYEFAIECYDCFDRYIELRIFGVHREIAIIDAFEMISCGASIANAHQLAIAAETNQYFKHNFKQRLAATRTSEFWDTNKSVNHLLCMLEDENVRDTVRFAAIRELNVMFGITIIDEHGNTRRGMSLDDFYKLESAKAPSVDDDPHSVH